MTPPAELDYEQDHIVTWAEVHRDTKILVRRLMGHGPWKGIVGISRGGLVPATILAREMEIRFVDTICISTYDEKSMGQVEMIKTPEAACNDQGEGWLLVDDLVDTGTTLKAAKALLPKSHVATVYAKPDGMPFVDTFVHEVPQKVWVYFPWDTDLQYTTPLGRGERTG
jgi:xanthine phosphoribosyltransferase